MRLFLNKGAVKLNFLKRAKAKENQLEQRC